MPELAVLTAPIPGEAPAGVSARYEPEFEALSAELDKMESVTKGEVNWRTVVELSSAILEKKSKDLMAGSALAVGLLATEGYGKFGEGLAVVRDLLVTYWDGLFPELKRLRARVASVQWLNDRGGPILASRPEPGESDREALTQCVTRMEELKARVGERFTEGEPPDLSLIERSLREKLAQIPVPVVEGPAVTSSEPSSDTSSSAPAAPKERVIDSPQTAAEALAEMRDNVFKAASVLQAAQPHDPAAFRLRRAAAWHLAPVLPALDNGRFAFDGPAADVAASFESRLAAGDADAVLNDAEGWLNQNPWWLDANLFSFRALEALGPRFKNAAAAVRSETAGLLARFPLWLDATFQNSVPVAGGRVRAWLAPASPSASDPAASARALVARGQLPEALASLHAHLASLTAGRARFAWRLESARICLEAGRPDIALPQLEALDSESREKALDSWEPNLSVDLLRTLLRCYADLPGEPGASEKARGIFARLCTLDLPAAATIRTQRT